MKLLSTVGLVACTISISSAVVNELNAWQYPGPTGGANIQWTIGIDRPLKWYTELTEYNITLWQNRAGTYPLNVGAIWQSTENNAAGNISYNWKVDPMEAELKDGDNFFLWGGWQCQDQPGCDEPNEGFTSWSFNLTYLQPSQITTTASAISTSTGSSSRMTLSARTSTSRPSASTAAAATNKDVKDDNDNNDNTVTIGAAVGASVGGLLLLGLGIFFGMRIAKRRAAARASIQASPMLHNQDYDDEHGGYMECKTQAARVQQHELPSEAPAELPAGDGKPRELGA